MPKTLEEMRAAARQLAAGVADRLSSAHSRASMKPLRKAEFQADDAEPERDPRFAAIDHVVMSKALDERGRELQDFNDFSQILAAALGRPVTETRYYQERMGKGAPLRKAMDTLAAGEGLEWVPTGYSEQWGRLIRLAAMVTPLFRPLEMPRNPYVFPFQSGAMTIKKLGQQTADLGTIIGESQPTTAKLTFDAVKLGGRIPWSTELEEDSLVPILPMLREEIAAAAAQALDSVNLNGDTTGPHMDSDVAALGADDARKSWKGLRYHAKSSADRHMDLSAFTTGNLGKLRALMGKYGVTVDNLAWITSPKVYARYFMTLAEVVTLEKYGAQATVLNGEMAKFAGIPVVVSGDMREDLNDVGVYDGVTTTKGAVILVNRQAWIFASRRKLDVKFWENPMYDQKFLVATFRHDFKTPWSADPVAVMGRKIDLS